MIVRYNAVERRRCADSSKSSFIVAAIVLLLLDDEAMTIKLPFLPHKGLEFVFCK